MCISVSILYTGSFHVFPVPSSPSSPADPPEYRPGSADPSESLGRRSAGARALGRKRTCDVASSAPRNALDGELRGLCNMKNGSTKDWLGHVGSILVEPWRQTGELVAWDWYITLRFNINKGSACLVLGTHKAVSLEFATVQQVMLCFSGLVRACP